MYDMLIDIGGTLHKLYGVKTPIEEIYEQAKNGDVLKIETVDENGSKRVTMIPYIGVNYLDCIFHEE